MDDDLQNPVSEIRILLFKLAEEYLVPECRLSVQRFRIKAARCVYKYWKVPVRSFFENFHACNKSTILRLHLVDCFKDVTGCIQS